MQKNHQLPKVVTQINRYALCVVVVAKVRFAKLPLRYAKSFALCDTHYALCVIVVALCYCKELDHV